MDEIGWSLFYRVKSKRKTPRQYNNAYIMEFRKMVTMTLYARQKNRHRCKEQTFDSVKEGEGGMI